MGNLAAFGALLAFVGVVMGFVTARIRKLILTATSFAMAIGGLLLFLGG